MFKATAYIVGPVDGPGAALRDMASGLGFEAVLPYAGPDVAEQQAARTPLLFFLVSATEDMARLEQLARQIRHHPGRRVRFSPIIYFSESPLVEAIDACVRYGFDDALTLPFTPSRLNERLGRQINRTVTYYETADYFGPDRRIHAMPSSLERRGGGRRRRFDLIRTAAAGVNILRDQVQTG